MPRKLSGPTTAEQRKWEAEDDLRALIRADEIRADKGRLSRAKTMARTKAKEAANIAGKVAKK